tara:strand:- start:490 stop:1110 length:621 start_codon:yes stop_codon:yes gene_type:complete
MIRAIKTIKVMNFIEYYDKSSTNLISSLTQEKVNTKKSNLMEAINQKNINSLSIKEIEQIIKKKGLDVSLSTIIPKILEKDSMFATLFYSRPALTTPHRSSILINYLLSKGIKLETTSPSIKPSKYSLPYLGNLGGVEVYYYLIDINKSPSHNEVIQRINIVKDNVEYSKSLIILDDVVSGGKMETSFPSIFKLNNVLNIKSFINE